MSCRQAVQPALVKVQLERRQHRRSRRDHRGRPRAKTRSTSTSTCERLGVLVVATALLHLPPSDAVTQPSLPVIFAEALMPVSTARTTPVSFAGASCCALLHRPRSRPPGWPGGDRVHGTAVVQPRHGVATRTSPIRSRATMTGDVIDETHHAAAFSYRRILGHLAPSPLILGVMYFLPANSPLSSASSYRGPAGVPRLCTERSKRGSRNSGSYCVYIEARSARKILLGTKARTDERFATASYRAPPPRLHGVSRVRLRGQQITSSKAHLRPPLHHADRGPIAIPSPCSVSNWLTLFLTPHG